MEEKYYHVVDGKVVPKPDNKRDPKRRYKLIVNAKDETSKMVELTPAEEEERDKEESEWKAKEPLRQAEAEEDSRRQERFRNSLIYQERYVAFLDILGWEAAIEKSSTDPELVKNMGISLQILFSQKKMIEWMHENDERDGWPGNPQITQFSDCIVISAQNDFSGKLFIEKSLNFITYSLLQNGLLIRGGVCIGSLFHKKDIVYGPGLVKAHKMESCDALFPRIILDKELAEAWGPNSRTIGKNGEVIKIDKTWRQSTKDTWWFFDYLQPFVQVPIEGDRLLIDSSFIAQLSHVREIIVKSLVEFKCNQKLLDKYIWLTNYFNSILKEYPDTGLVNIDLGKLNTDQANNL